MNMVDKITAAATGATESPTPITTTGSTTTDKSGLIVAHFLRDMFEIHLIITASTLATISTTSGTRGDGLLGNNFTFYTRNNTIPEL